MNYDPDGRAVIVNLSNGPVTTSQNRFGGGQEIFIVPPNRTSGFRDADTLIANDGTVIKIPDPVVVFIFDQSSLDSFSPDTVSDLLLVQPFPFLPANFNPRFIEDPESVFGPFFDGDERHEFKPCP